MAAQSKMADFFLLFIGKNQRIKIFAFCKIIFIFFGKNKKVGEKSKMAAKNQDGVG
jgi:hypothetical protein